MARRALEAGADILNDVSALRFDPEMASVAAETGAPVILMHMLGTPKTMQEAPVYQALLAEVSAFLEERIQWAVSRGVDRNQIIVDPGIGFGKTVTHNLRLIRDLDVLSSLERPLLLGVSRKRFIGSILDRPVEDREIGTAVANAFGVAAGATSFGSTTWECTSRWRSWPMHSVRAVGANKNRPRTKAGISEEPEPWENCSERTGFEGSPTRIP